ncbi:MAG: hypothetical protein O2968_22815 [Acidobacteria bacterium]|nr:hypothetical protein [Acidobacteriota bacterium]
MSERNIAQHFDKISDTVGLLDMLISSDQGHVRDLFLDAVKQTNFFVYEIDHKIEMLRQVDVWNDLRDLVECLKKTSARGLEIDTLEFLRYFSRQLSMYRAEHQIIHGQPVDPKARDYVTRFFDDNVDYVDTGYYYSLAYENRLISADAVRHGHNASKALDIVDAVEDYEEDVVSNTYPPFVLYLVHARAGVGGEGASRPSLSVILDHGNSSIDRYRAALRNDVRLPKAESDIFE